MNIKQYADLEDKVFHIIVNRVGKKYPDDSSIEIQFEILELKETFTTEITIE